MKFAIIINYYLFIYYYIYYCHIQENTDLSVIEQRPQVQVPCFHRQYTQSLLSLLK